jgi:hypothetical protein
MTTPPETALLRARVQELEHLNTEHTGQVADLERHNKELRETVRSAVGAGPSAVSNVTKTRRAPLVTRNTSIING